MNEIESSSQPPEPSILFALSGLFAHSLEQNVLNGWEAVFAQLPWPIVIACAPAGEIVFCNPAATHLLYPPTSQKPRPLCEWQAVYRHAFYSNGQPYEPEAHPLLRALHQGVETSHEEMLYRQKAGMVSLLSVSAAALRDAQDRIVASIALFEDISARKQHELSEQRRCEHLQDNLEALQVTQEDLLIMRTELDMERQRYQELFEFATDGYLVTDLQGIILEANSAACARLGLTPLYVKGKILANYIHLEDRHSFRALLNNMKHEPNRVEWEGCLMPRHDGVRDVQMTVAVTRHPQTGEPHLLRWLLRDITQRRQLERARQVDHERLLEQEHRAGIQEERTRIAQEFHDTLAQGFTGLSFLLSAAENALPNDTEHAKVQIQRAQQVATTSMQEARQAIRAMRSETLEVDGLSKALAVLVEQATAHSGIPVMLTIKGRVRALPAQITNDLLRIGQEATTNALKHARAGAIQLCLEFEPTQVRLRIEDDGRGFDAEVQPPGAGFGLVGMRERARRIQAKLEIEGKIDAGAAIVVTVPLIPEHPY